jgi:probable F420-dependent oxidoreductase
MTPPTPPQPRRFRFGVSVPPPADPQQWAELARRVEGLGYDVLLVGDHFTGRTAGQLAPVPAMVAAAAVTRTLRLGALVFGNDFRHPLVLAKELASVDVLSGGRLELGMGAGWMPSDYEQLGIAMDSARVRIDRFGEAIQIIRQAMGPSPFSFAGEHYTVTGYEGFPKPVQLPAPPVLIGGGGERMLRIAARQADIVDINLQLHAGRLVPRRTIMAAEGMDAMVELVRATAGERMERIELSHRAFHVDVSANRAEAIASASLRFEAPESRIIETPFALIGSRDSIVEDLLRSRERWGLSYVIVGPDCIDSFAPVVAVLGAHTRSVAAGG